MKNEAEIHSINIEPIFEGKGLDYDVPLLISSGRDEEISGVDIEDFSIDDFDLYIGVEERDDLNIPSHSEPDIIRHFTRLSQKNYSI